MRRKSHVRCGAGEKLEIISKIYLLLLFVVMSSKKIKNPVTLFKEDYEKGKYNSLSNSEISAISKKEKAKAEIWDSQPQADVLTLYFNATDRLPRNQMRTLVG